MQVALPTIAIRKLCPVWLLQYRCPKIEVSRDWSPTLVLTVVTSLVLIFLFLPYTLLLLLGHKLYPFTGKKYCCWLMKLIPLLDSYYAPYKIHARYWTGFLLLIRCALYVVFLRNFLSPNKRLPSLSACLYA